MKIAVAGPYSALTEKERQENLDRMNRTAAILLEAGHIPIIGMNAALPVIKMATLENEYKAIMDISLALTEQCDAIVLLAESPGANKERDLMVKSGKPVFQSAEEAIRHYKARLE
jgi:Domain of unknown function (DUF4406)